MKQTNTIIKMTGLSKVYKLDEIEVHALEEVNLEVKKGDFLAITGRSGSGKSTLMHILGLLDLPSGGDYILDGTNVSTLHEDKLAEIRNKEIGFVFQSFNLLPRYSALENVVLPAIYFGTKPTERNKKAADFLTKLGLEEHLNKMPNQMSGGQQQRVAIARSLMNNPSIILADEPTGNLDTASGNEVMKTLKELNADGKTIILITHEADIAQQAKKIMRIEDGRLLS